MWSYFYIQRKSNRKIVRFFIIVHPVGNAPLNIYLKKKIEVRSALVNYNEATRCANILSCGHAVAKTCSVN